MNEKPPKPLWRRTLKKLHLWIGLAICVPVVIMGITGSMLVLGEQLAGIFTPPYKLAEGRAASVQDIIKSAKDSAPDGFKPMMYIAPLEEGKAASVRLNQGEHRGPGGMLVLVDPVSLSIITGNEGFNSFMRQVLQLHSTLLLRDYGGRDIVGWLGVAMLLMGFSGLAIWWPKPGNKPGKWKAAFTIKSGATGIRLHHDLHGFTGIWGFPVFLIISFTGIYLSFPQAMGNMIGARDMRAASSAIHATKIEGTDPVNADSAIEIAMQAVPGSKAVSVMLPGKQQPYRVNLVPIAEKGVPSTSVFIDPWSKQILEIQDPQKYTTADKFATWQRIIHVGREFGWGWRTLVFITGLCPLLFAITGIYMWYTKRKNRALNKINKI